MQDEAKLDAATDLKGGRAQTRAVGGRRQVRRPPRGARGGAAVASSDARARLLVELFTWRGGGGGGEDPEGGDAESVYLSDVLRFINEASAKLDHITEIAADMIERMDRDGDGKIQLEELKHDAARNPTLYTVLLGLEPVIARA